MTYGLAHEMRLMYSKMINYESNPGLFFFHPSFFGLKLILNWLWNLQLLHSFRFENSDNKWYVVCRKTDICFASFNSTWDIYLWLYYNLVLFVKGVIAPFSHGFREQIAINVGGGRSGCHQMIFIWSWEKNLGSLSLVAVSG